jgi:hypothetical protein
MTELFNSRDIQKHKYKTSVHSKHHRNNLAIQQKADNKYKWNGLHTLKFHHRNEVHVCAYMHIHDKPAEILKPDNHNIKYNIKTWDIKDYPRHLTWIYKNERDHGHFEDNT